MREFQLLFGRNNRDLVCKKLQTSKSFLSIIKTLALHLLNHFAFVEANKFLSDFLGIQYARIEKNVLQNIFLLFLSK